MFRMQRADGKPFSDVCGHVGAERDGVFVRFFALGAQVRPIGVVTADVDLQLVHLEAKHDHQA